MVGIDFSYFLERDTWSWKILLALKYKLYRDGLVLTGKGIYYFMMPK